MELCGCCSPGLAYIEFRQLIIGRAVCSEKLLYAYLEGVEYIWVVDYTCFICVAPSNSDFNCMLFHKWWMRRPGVEPGLKAWKALVIPLDHRRLCYWINWVIGFLGEIVFYPYGSSCIRLGEHSSCFFMSFFWMSYYFLYR